jgi:4-hydroxy-3-methylbut-2-enyl diphosphate reductase
MDSRKQDYAPTLLDFGPVRFYIARHFGFCYGVENAIEISYRALEENPGKRVFLLSQMIHNQEVNRDLEELGIRFVMDPEGNHFVPWEELKAGDVVVVPAFGTTVEIESLLLNKGINIEKYNTTCPFVEKVWNRASKLGSDGYTVIIHGKPGHEETRATFSHSRTGAPSVIIRNMEEAHLLSRYIHGQASRDDFYREFSGRHSEGFDPEVHLKRVGVVNQTTMLASETQAIADYFREQMAMKYGRESVRQHFADTRDTLCYATNDNQSATYELLKGPADLAIVVGGYNSSNTSHIVELCEQKFPTYFINSYREMESESRIRHFDIHRKERVTSPDFLIRRSPLTVVLTSGASCPDTLVDQVLLRILSWFPGSRTVEEVLTEFTSA